MSVRPLEADIHQGDGYVSFVPSRDMRGDLHVGFGTPTASPDQIVMLTVANRSA